MKEILLGIFLSFSVMAEECGPRAKTVGEGTLSWSWLNIKLYHITHKKGDDHSTHLTLKFHRDISKTNLNKGWEKGLKDHLQEKYDGEFASAVNWIMESTPDAQKEDCLVLSINGPKVEMKQNGRTIASTTDENVGRILFLPWIGDKGVDPHLRDKLRGLK